ncbi:MAG: hypothetical protein ABI304_01000 [Rudaea sp.]
MFTVIGHRSAIWRNWVKHRYSIAAMLALALASTDAGAAQGVVLPSWVCTYPDAIFVNGFQTGETAVVRIPSQGSGGAYPGDVTRNVFVSGLGTQPYYLHLPSNYTRNHSWPVMLALHGSGGPGTSDMYARQVRSDWSTLADAEGFIVAAPVGTDSQSGGWNAPAVNGSGPSDYDIIAAALADVGQAYDVEDTRIYAWGYSAGGEVLDDIVLTGWVGLNANSFAGYAVTGTALAGCPTYNTVQSCVPANAARIIPLDIHIGDSDQIYTHGYASSDESAFLAAGWSLGTTLFYTVFTDGNPPGGHTYTAAHLLQDWNHLCPNAVLP